MRELKPPPPDSYGVGYFDDAARIRARDLLWNHLTDQQRAEYAECGYFTVRGHETAETYKVMRGNVRRLSDMASFCLVVHDFEDHVPVEDQMLVKKILIEKDEDLFLRTANYNEIRPLRR